MSSKLTKAIIAGLERDPEGHNRRPEALKHTNQMKISCQTIWSKSNDDKGDLEVHRNARSRAHKRLRAQRSKQQTPVSVDRSRSTPSPAPPKLTGSGFVIEESILARTDSKFNQFCRRAGACDYELDSRANWKTSVLPSPAHELLSASPDNEPTSRTAKVFEEARRIALAGHHVKLGNIAAGHDRTMLPKQDLVLRHRPLAAVTRLKAEQWRPTSKCPQSVPFSRRLEDRRTLLVLRGLKAGTRESHIRDAFDRFGLLKINLPRDQATRNSREFAFITFETVSDAQAAFDAMNGQMIGRPQARIEVCSGTVLVWCLKLHDVFCECWVPNCECARIQCMQYAHVFTQSMYTCMQIVWGHQRRAQSPLRQINHQSPSSPRFASTAPLQNSLRATQSPATSWQTQSACHSPAYQLSGTFRLDELSIPGSPPALGVLSAPVTPSLSPLSPMGLESVVEANFLKKMVELS